MKQRHQQLPLIETIIVKGRSRGLITLTLVFAFEILQVVIGPPGSGKTTYCNGMYQFLNGMER